MIICGILASRTSNAVTAARAKAKCAVVSGRLHWMDGASLQRPLGECRIVCGPLSGCPSIQCRQKLAEKLHELPLTDGKLS